MAAKEQPEILDLTGGHELTFDQMISPLSRDSFVANFWGKSFLHLPGKPGRFSKLLSWDELNCVLEQHRLAPPRIRLVRDAKPIDSSLFMDGNKRHPSLNSAGLTNSLAEGATLIIDAVNELAPAVGNLAEAFQEVLRSETTVNLYAGWRVQKGFDLHWDTQDTMIVQLSGRKHWKVYSPTRLHPFKNEVELTPKPTGEPVWDGVLEDGAVLYLPRGWWHVAFPLDEPSLHLTVTIVPANGIDFLGWFVEQLKPIAEVRMNVPHLSVEAERKLYSSRLSEILATFGSDDTLEKFIADWEAKFPVRPRVRLPDGPIESKHALTMESSVRLAMSRGLVFLNTTNETVSYHASGVVGECSIGLVPALRQLSGVSIRSVAELCAHLPDQSQASKLMIVLSVLAMKGVLHIFPPGSGV